MLCTRHSTTHAAGCAVQKQKDSEGNETLDPSEKLFVVHVYSGKKERWDAGGPLLPNMSTALANYPHKIVELEKVRSPSACTLWPRSCVALHAQDFLLG